VMTGDLARLEKLQEAGLLGRTLSGLSSAISFRLQTEMDLTT